VPRSNPKIRRADVPWGTAAVYAQAIGRDEGRDASALKTASSGAIFVPSLEADLRTTLALDDDLMAKAQAFTGLKEKSNLVREALKALIERESARRLALLGGSEPTLEVPPRRRPTEE
jgi:Arc/MetJ family transcription regulator